MDKERFQLLLDRHFDQLLTAEERPEFEQMLLASAGAREDFWAQARWHGFMRLWGETEWGRREAKIIPLSTLAPGAAAKRAKTAHRGMLRRLWPLAAAACCLLVAGLIGYRLLLPKSQPPLFRGIAVLTRISESAWLDNRPALQVGEALHPGWLRLERGAVQIEFSSGARVILEGPAELQLVSENEAFLRRGKLGASVPKPAHGFKVGAPEFTVVDHGTEFGCIVGTAGAAELHVFSGAVSWQPTGNVAGRELKKNQALRISQQRAQPMPANRAAFLAEDELARLDAARERTRLVDWRIASAALRDHPATVLYLDFERPNPQQRVLANRAKQSPPGSDASIIGCDSVDGRWSGKGAVEFKRPNDRLRLTMPGTFPALTLLAWVRVDGLVNRQQSLAMAESFALGETHWYVFRNGALGLGVHTDTPEQMHGWRNHHSLPALPIEKHGDWHFVASTCDNRTGVVNHYLDGQLISTFNRGIHVLLRLDTFEIGNWGVRPDDSRLAEGNWGQKRDAIRNFQGRMDEFAILATVLRLPEIRQLYREGRPGETILTSIASPGAGAP